MRRLFPLLFAAAGTIVVLWQMLLPGYVLTWDMVFGPSHTFPALSGILNGLPLKILIYVAGFAIPMWLVQKGILIGLFFSLFYLPLRFFPFDKLRAGHLEIDEWAKYAAASLYAVNPFVYERFLAGQWGVLAAYALLAPFVYFLFALLERPDRKSALYLALTMLLIGVFSLHAFVMSALVAGVVLGIASVRRGLPLLTHAALAATIVGIGSLYWLVPLLLYPASSPIGNFGDAHRAAFATSVDPVIFGNAGGNVLMLYGFWGESYPWMQTLLSPKEHLAVFLPALFMLATIVSIGIMRLFRASEDRERALMLMAVGIAAAIFSVGVAPSIFQSFNTWLFEHLSFWRGFRDTEKWSMWLALSYSYFFAAGAAYVVARLRPQLTRIAQVLFVILPLAYTFTMLGGFAGQLRAIEYPSPWYEVNAILAQDPACKALFLPWHQYYWLAFNDGRLTSNPARHFFDCEIVTSQDAEIGEIGDQGKAASDLRYLALAQAITSNDSAGIDATLLLFRELGIRYIVATDDIRKYDQFTYPFLGDPSLELLYNEVVDNQGIALFRL